MNHPGTVRDHPHQVGQIILLGMEEIFGHHEIESVINQNGRMADLVHDQPCDMDQDFSFESISQVQACLQEAYGLAAGHGLAIRTGRASFKHILRKYGSQAGLTDPEFRLLPLPSRLLAGCRSLAKLFNKRGGQQVELLTDPEYITWNMAVNPQDRHSLHTTPACYLTVGMLQEALYWVSAGKIFQVEETQCIASGAPCCSIRITKTPIH